MVCNQQRDCYVWCGSPRGGPHRCSKRVGPANVGTLSISFAVTRLLCWTPVVGSALMDDPVRFESMSSPLCLSNHPSPDKLGSAAYCGGRVSPCSAPRCRGRGGAGPMQ